MTITYNLKNQEFFTCPDNFFFIGSFTGTNVTCKHNDFTKVAGVPNHIGQYSITRTCNDCGAYRKYMLYAKTARKVGRK